MKTLENNIAHIIVDFQNDFVQENGTLSVKAEALGGKIGSIIEACKAKGIKNIATKDWHPEDHISFSSSRGEEATYVDGSRPNHCIAGTWGAELHWTINHKQDQIIHKGTDKNKEAYSGFEGTLLGSQLKNQQVKTVIITGVATDYCVEATARDAIKEGLRTIIIRDAIKAVDPTQEEIKIEAMKKVGIEFSTSQEIIKELKKITQHLL